MQLQDKIDGMKKLLDRESDRCQEMIKNEKMSETSNNEGDSGLKDIIERQNQIIEQQRQKILTYESKL
jgi:hypothetical protein